MALPLPLLVSLRSDVQFKTNIYIYCIIALLGILQAYALASPWSGQANASLQLISLAGFLIALRKDTTLKQRFLQAWVFTTSWLIASVWWLYIFLHEFNEAPVPLTLLLIFLLCGPMALYYAVTISLYFKWKTTNPWISGILFATCWTLAEIARAEFFTGFPWGAIGYAHVDSVLVIFAPWVGVYGVCWVAAFLAASLSSSILKFPEKTKKQKYISAAIAVGLIAVLLVPWKLSTPATNTSFSVSLLQGHTMPQTYKYSEIRRQGLSWYVDEALQAKTDLVVMPEIAIDYLQKDIPDKAWEKLKQHFSSGNQAIISGIPTLKDNQKFGNSAIAIRANADEYLYDKQHLVPFGEFVPTSIQWVNKAVNFGNTEFVSSSMSPQPFMWNKQSLAIQICYEDLFGEELAKRFTNEEVATPTVLVNLGNIVWFGNTVVVPQHLNIARMRSIELNRPTVRATNSGGTAIIDSVGTIQAVAKPYIKTVLVGNVPASDGRVTWFARWAGRWGLMPLWVICLSILAMFALGGLKKRQQHAG
jgi:apolipoprotein N-acyltransferase